MEQFKLKAKKLLKLCNIVSFSPVYNGMHARYNWLCLGLALINFAENNDVAIIMDGIWNEKQNYEAFIESVKKFKHPAWQKLFKENQIL